MRLSIRWRLTLWNTLAVALVLLAFGALQYGLLTRALYQRLDRSLGEQLQTLRTKGESRLEYWIEEFYEHEKTFCVIYRPDGQVRSRTEVLAADSVPSAPADPGAEVHLHDADLPIIRRQRLLTARVAVGGQDCVVVLMTSLEEADRERNHLFTVLLTAAPVALVVAAGLGYVLARKALAPIEQLRRATQEVTAQRLDRRLPVANPRDELGRMALTINDMIQRLERSFAEVRRFTADASHELRTPLTVIRTEAELALSACAGSPQERHLLGSILEECERLTRLTDQLLTLSREDAGVAPLVREEIDLVSLVGDVTETMRPLAEAKGLRLQAVGARPVRVRGDAGRLRQVFYNLLDNAIKYTPEGGEVEARVEARDGQARTTIRDTGVGIPPEHLPHVFDRFYRVDKARSREQGGTGLGLSITRSIVNAHGGHVELDSTPGRGTTCTLTLPLSDQRKETTR
jgi:heavy metal sensor kinase